MGTLEGVAVPLYEGHAVQHGRDDDAEFNGAKGKVEFAHGGGIRGEEGRRMGGERALVADGVRPTEGLKAERMRRTAYVGKRRRAIRPGG
jgi:hypothetical protein